LEAVDLADLDDLRHPFFDVGELVESDDHAFVDCSGSVVFAVEQFFGRRAFGGLVDDGVFGDLFDLADERFAA